MPLWASQIGSCGRWWRCQKKCHDRWIRKKNCRMGRIWVPYESHLCHVSSTCHGSLSLFAESLRLSLLFSFLRWWRGFQVFGELCFKHLRRPMSAPCHVPCWTSAMLIRWSPFCALLLPLISTVSRTKSTSSSQFSTPKAFGFNAWVVGTRGNTLRHWTSLNITEPPETGRSWPSCSTSGSKMEGVPPELQPSDALKQIHALFCDTFWPLSL